MPKRIVCENFDDIRNIPLETFVNKNGAIGSDAFSPLNNGVFVYIVNHCNMNSRTRSRKGYSLKAYSTIKPGQKIVNFIGDIIEQSDLSHEDGIQYVRLTNGLAIQRPSYMTVENSAWCANDANYEKNNTINNAFIKGNGRMHKNKKTAVSLESKGYLGSIKPHTDIMTNYGSDYHARQKANNLEKEMEQELRKINETSKIRAGRRRNSTLHVNAIKKKKRDKLIAAGIEPLARGRPTKETRWKKRGIRK